MKIILLAWATYLTAPLGLAAVFGFMAYIQRFQITPEELTLVKLFGAEFQAYQATVRRWLKPITGAARVAAQRRQ